ncbi:hypothetical protein JCGZ_06586 [Jatropha curcas]|uniref:Uncharacterized protein n=1 Tax=Jatropha curcas TaxID=180498 RepID=A0A067LMM7_JATCU|nr:hypothetical protein JCGZ_06586 [Jatropha curcas]
MPVPDSGSPGRETRPSKGGHITVSGIGTVSSNRSRTVTGIGPNQNRNRRFSVPVLMEPQLVVPKNRSKPDGTAGSNQSKNQRV